MRQEVQNRGVVIGGTMVHATSAERITDPVLSSTQTLHKSLKNDADAEKLQCCNVPSDDHHSLSSPSPNNFAKFVNVLFPLLFVLKLRFIVRCHGGIMDEKSNEICSKMPHLARDNQTIVS